MLPTCFPHLAWCHWMVIASSSRQSSSSDTQWIGTLGTRRSPGGSPIFSRATERPALLQASQRFQRRLIWNGPDHQQRGAPGKVSALLREQAPQWNGLAGMNLGQHLQDAGQLLGALGGSNLKQPRAQAGRLIPRTPPTVYPRSRAWLASAVAVENRQFQEVRPSAVHRRGDSPHVQEDDVVGRRRGVVDPGLEPAKAGGGLPVDVTQTVANDVFSRAHGPGNVVQDTPPSANASVRLLREEPVVDHRQDSRVDGEVSIALDPLLATEQTEEVARAHYGRPQMKMSPLAAVQVYRRVMRWYQPRDTRFRRIHRVESIAGTIVP